MEQEEILKQLATLIKAQIELAYTDPSKAEETAGMGMLMSKYFKWTGRPIVESCLYGLEDSNFHDWVGQISELLKIEI